MNFGKFFFCVIFSNFLGNMAMSLENHLRDKVKIYSVDGRSDSFVVPLGKLVDKSLRYRKTFEHFFTDMNSLDIKIEKNGNESLYLLETDQSSQAIELAFYYILDNVIPNFQNDRHIQMAYNLANEWEMPGLLENLKEDNFSDLNQTMVYFDRFWKKENGTGELTKVISSEIMYCCLCSWNLGRISISDLKKHFEELHPKDSICSTERKIKFVPNYNYFMEFFRLNVKYRNVNRE